MAKKEAEFKQGQEFMILDMIVNGTRRDVYGHYVKENHRNDTHVWVVINTVQMLIDKKRLIDPITYWKDKNGSST